MPKAKPQQEELKASTLEQPSGDGTIPTPQVGFEGVEIEKQDEITSDFDMQKFTANPHHVKPSAGMSRVVEIASSIAKSAAPVDTVYQFCEFDDLCMIALRTIGGTDMSELENSSPVFAVFCEAVRRLYGRL
jgi:hypothetical protein